MVYFDLFRRSFAFIPKNEVVVEPLEPEEIDSDIAALKQLTKNTDITLNSAKNIIKSEDEQKFEKLLSNLLKFGVLIASAVVLFGGIIYLVHHGTEPARYQLFRGEPSNFCSPLGVIKALLAGSDRAIIQLGILLMIATPIIRVIISLFAFLSRRIWSFVIITLLVLTSLIYSLVGGYY
ncbi:MULTISPECIES: DUF1634 domain-containing protein [unclassified Tolypothrix]|uniref:DUF1634 domain-containing protein n=1 Tax=unclassified Tolypothrix TaxID=2649714 RepID=UPI0005EAAAEE|nr:MULTISPECIES: DUF1634 domain-containing protein [unclassified Tolypothrix]BAY89312.1 hypothetical protein NIES3275_13150 [Microchaete diplosiphon NIES-3275]EKE97817.1 hypothetical protein FDUTEX481_04767 [Tolypothrix sp. PCC 7601]MBE9082807.1 DUF1634 domain-containing protein [Tolypothrix sp. LEGE 11397]UYD23591.1 DUF1634 domain-containing protein [Tolypothrix sp. PCC 7712]UYD34181.1 DUF1634 domain-containing protein [Tolypothrix sp. PCC 7601]